MRHKADDAMAGAPASGEGSRGKAGGSQTPLLSKTTRKATPPAYGRQGVSRPLCIILLLKPVEEQNIPLLAVRLFSVRSSSSNERAIQGGIMYNVYR